MARIFKQTYTKSLPDDAEIVTRKGRRHARFKDGKGKTVTVPLSKDGAKIILETVKWYIDYKDDSGKSCRKAGYVDRQATEQLASELERTAEHVRSGYKPKQHQHLARPLMEHLADFQSDLIAKGTSAEHAKVVHARTKKIIKGCCFHTWSDISATRVQRFLAKHREDTEERRGISAQTSNWYLQAIKGFCAWLTSNQRAPESPLRHLKGLNVKTDRRHDRRALTDDECRRLLTAAVAGQGAQSMKGGDRALLYRAALETGLRASELRTLTVGACHLQENPPVLIVKAAYSKHRREDVQPIPPGLAEALISHTADREADELIFSGMPNRTAQMLRRDLKTARDQWIADADTERERERREEDKNFLRYRDSANMVADFHSLRHTYITNLARIGVHPKTAMDLARHGSINLTMSRYSHTLVADRAGALGDLPSLNACPEAEEQKATGTYGALAQIGDSPPDTTSGTTSRAIDNRKLLSIKLIGENGTGLENQRARKGTVGSNPTPTVTAQCIKELRDDLSETR